jgi:hypothetical protein
MSEEQEIIIQENKAAYGHKTRNLLHIGGLLPIDALISSSEATCEAYNNYSAKTLNAFLTQLKEKFPQYEFRVSFCRQGSPAVYIVCEGDIAKDAFVQEELQKLGGYEYEKTGQIDNIDDFKSWKVKDSLRYSMWWMYEMSVEKPEQFQSSNECRDIPAYQRRVKALIEANQTADILYIRWS